MLDFDMSFVMQLANFIITLVVLNILLLRPVRGVIARRKALISETVEETQKFTEEAATSLENYQKDLDAARRQAFEARTSLKEAGLVDEQEILESAQSVAAKSLVSEREDLVAQSNALKSELKNRIPALADLATTQILK